MNWSEPYDEPTEEQRANLRYYIPTRAEIEEMKRLIRAEKGETDPIPEHHVRYDVIRHLLGCDEPIE